MSWLRKLVGGDAEGTLRKADASFDARRFGEAKLAYERARDALEGEARDRVDARIAECRDSIARARLAEAEHILAQGHKDLAREEVAGALEVAASAEVRAAASVLAERLEREDAIEQAAEIRLDDGERLALLAGQWEGPQADEYQDLGRPLRDALLALLDERGTDARAALEKLLAEAKTPRFLYLEVARARLMTDDRYGARDALERFLAAARDLASTDVKLLAHLELAAIALAAGDAEKVIERYGLAIDDAPEDPRPYAALGRFLRTQGHTDEAVEVLESALPFLDPNRPDWRILEERALCLRAAGRDEDAIEALEGIVLLFSRGGSRDLPPETATALAELQEKKGRLERAADLYRTLAAGSDRSRHLRYHREAGRLLAALGVKDDARRMWQRARALAKDDAETAAEIDADLAALDRP